MKIEELVMVWLLVVVVCLVIVSRGDEMSCKFLSSYQSNGPFPNMHGVAVTSSGGITLTEPGHGRVQLSENWFSPRKSFPSKLFNGPSGIAVDRARGRVFVTNKGKGRVHAYSSSSGRLLFSISGLSEPTGVALDSSAARVFVADIGHEAVKVFDASTGTFLASFGSSGSAADQFRLPCAVAVDSNGVYVCDQMNNRVQVWS